MEKDNLEKSSFPLKIVTPIQMILIDFVCVLIDRKLLEFTYEDMKIDQRFSQSERYKLVRQNPQADTRVPLKIKQT